jgi:anti-sigma B factor antagonist
MSAASRLTTRDDDEGIRTVRFQDRQLFDESTARLVGEELAAAVPRSGPIAMILDFSGVESISSTMLTKLILLQRRVDGAGGRLRMCELEPAVLDVVRTSRLDRIFQIDRDLRESREALAGAHG